MKKLAIIGASYLQNPLILKAKEMGVETHVFAWAAGDIGEQTADFFYPISTIEKDEILQRCKKIGVDGVTTIASDLAAITAGYVANALGLTCNSPECIAHSSNKALMRRAFDLGGDPSPQSVEVTAETDFSKLNIRYPLIVKPADRSGSRGVSKLVEGDILEQAVDRAIGESFSKTALVEEFVEGSEFSVECISWQGRHRFLAITEKFTTGAPTFIETAHLEPARIDDESVERVKRIVYHALDSLDIEYGASHSELKIAEDGTIRIIEIGARMGGDCIGSDLVRLSTGYDFLKAVIDVALGVEPIAPVLENKEIAAVRFIFDNEDLDALHAMRENDPEILIRSSEPESINHDVTDSSNRFGYYLFSAESAERVYTYLPVGD